MKVLGSFVFEGSAYNYEFRNTAIDNYSFRITQADPLAPDTTTETTSGENTAVTPAERSDETAPVEENINAIVADPGEEEEANDERVLFSEFSRRSSNRSLKIRYSHSVQPEPMRCKICPWDLH